MNLFICRDGTAHASTSDAPALGERAPPLSLDRFCATHTSEDNASFAEVLAASNKRRRLAQPWLFEDKSQVRCCVCQHAAVGVAGHAAADVMSCARHLLPSVLFLLLVVVDDRRAVKLV